MNITGRKYVNRRIVGLCLTAASAVLAVSGAVLLTYDVYREHVRDKKLEAERARESHAVAEIEKLEGIVIQDGRPPDQRVTRVFLVPIGRVVDGKTVITKSVVTDEDLRHLRVLTDLEEVRLSADGFSNAGLEHLRGLTNLKSLSIDNPNVTDEELESLKGLTSLQTLDLSRTKVTDKGVEPLQRSLADCTITR